MVNRDKKYAEGKPLDSYKHHPSTPTLDPSTPNNPTSTPIDQPWLTKNLIVKILQKDLCGGKLYKQLAKIYKAIDPSPTFSYMGNLKILSGPSKGTKVRVDQVNLGQVVPNKGEKVMVLKGKFRGKVGVMGEVEGEQGVVEVEGVGMLKLDFE